MNEGGAAGKGWRWHQGSSSGGRDCRCLHGACPPACRRLPARSSSCGVLLGFASILSCRLFLSFLPT